VGERGLPERTSCRLQELSLFETPPAEREEFINRGKKGENAARLFPERGGGQEGRGLATGLISGAADLFAEDEGGITRVYYSAPPKESICENPGKKKKMMTEEAIEKEVGLYGEEGEGETSSGPKIA